MKKAKLKELPVKLRVAMADVNNIMLKQGHVEEHYKRKKTVSTHTQNERLRCYERAFRTLHARGYLVEKVASVGQRHIKILAEEWEKKGLGASQIQKSLSNMRFLGNCVGNPNLVPPCEELFTDEKFYKRTYAAEKRKSWTANDVDVEAIVNCIAEADAFVAVQVLLCFAFGMRVKESQLFRPIEDDGGDRISIHRGAKGGRPRVVPLTKEFEGFQRGVLDLAKQFVNKTTGSTIPQKYTATKWYRHAYWVFERYGNIGKNASGVTMHGLRHDYLERLYEVESGLEAPLKRLERLTPGQREFDDYARHVVAQHAGHARKQISTAYVGSSRPKRRE